MMKRRSVHFILITALVLFTVSCGIPNIYVPSSSDVSIVSNSKEDGWFTVNFSHTVLNELRDGSPTIYFFYTISEESQSSSFSEAIKKFNSTYCSETGGQIIDSESGKPVAEYSTGSGESQKTYGLYQLSLESFDLEQVYSTELTLKKYADGTLMLCDENGYVLSSSIKRYNSKAFKRSLMSSDDEIVDYSVSNYYTVRVYALVSCQFNNYNNVFNTTLSSSSPILEFSLEE